MGNCCATRNSAKHLRKTTGEHVEQSAGRFITIRMSKQELREFKFQTDSDEIGQLLMEGWKDGKWQVAGDGGQQIKPTNLETMFENP